MEKKNGVTPSRKGKHLNWNERILIEGFLKAGLLEVRIAPLLERGRRTIGREIVRGQVEHPNSDLTPSMVFNADRAQAVHDQNASAKGPTVKLKAHSTAVEFIRCYIVIQGVVSGISRCPNEAKGHGGCGLCQNHLQPY